MPLDPDLNTPPARESVARNVTSVQIIRWPSESRKREHCRTRRIPRLLLLDGRTAAPVCIDELEDWIRPPVSRDDLNARVATLRARAAAGIVPVMDTDEVLRYGGRWLALSPVEVRLMGALVDSYRSVVSRNALIERGWPENNGEEPRRNALDLHILRLRRRLVALRLAIRTVWGRGYLLEPDAALPPLASSGFPAPADPWLARSGNGR